MENNRKKSYLWNHFTVTASDSKYATCNICNSKISRGSHNPKLQSLSGLSSHLRSRHPQLTLKNLLTEKAILTTTDNLKIYQLQINLSLLQLKKEQYPYLTSDQNDRELKCCNLQCLAGLTISQKSIQTLKSEVS